MLTQKLEIPVAFFGVGAVIDVEYPFEDSNESKMRPAVIIEEGKESMIAVSLKISSSLKYEDEGRYPYAIEIQKIKPAGLNKRSWVLADKELEINKKCKLHLKGHMADDDIERVKLFHDLALADDKVVRLEYEEEA